MTEFEAVFLTPPLPLSLDSSQTLKMAITEMKKLTNDDAKKRLIELVDVEFRNKIKPMVVWLKRKRHTE